MFSVYFSLFLFFTFLKLDIRDQDPDWGEEYDSHLEVTEVKFQRDLLRDFGWRGIYISSGNF